MIELKINQENWSSLNTRQKSILRIWCTLEYNFVAMGWYAGDTEGKVSLPNNEKIMH